MESNTDLPIKVPLLLWCVKFHEFFAIPGKVELV